MRRFAVTLGLTVGCLTWLAPVPSASAAADRTAEAIVKEIDAVKMPDLSKVNREDRASVMKYVTERQEANAKKSALIGELYKVDPNSPRLAKLLPERWQALLMSGPNKAKDVQKELAEVQAHSKDAALKVDAAYFNAVIVLRTGDNDPKARIEAAESFVKAAPKDERGAMLLYSVASELEDTALQTTLYKRVAKEYPESQVAAMVQGTLKQLESIGKPFDLEFTDAIKGTEVSMKTSLKGKVVVVDFWATWCGPCVAEMPNMKKLYGEYHDKGVEFVGISLDSPKEEGGLDELKRFVAQNEVPWPQYYQGKGWESEFSKSWGINAIPALFVVDAEGKLFSVNARGKLEEMLPNLLKKAKPAAGAGAGGN